MTEGERLEKRRGEIATAFELHFTRQETVARRSDTFHDAREKHANPRG